MDLDNWQNDFLKFYAIPLKLVLYGVADDALFAYGYSYLQCSVALQHAVVVLYPSILIPFFSIKAALFCGKSWRIAFNIWLLIFQKGSWIIILRLPVDFWMLLLICVK